ncbi:MAG: response regulator [Maricaulis sp.]|uniref:response regulator n=1 Tax=Maricaulis sp. TaxID=1486257 RepID=UPI001B10C1E3|nr:response regulator [Maricaulis sp.]MBO6729114.1 response regulator [Maricaulis sp.]MBO6848352.1 response regulator [Maricaulis sp.]MBO6878812.1 response regulator [Maricaulis sp.]MDM7985426.1 response regulator [Maricaulis sp.]
MPTQLLQGLNILVVEDVESIRTLIVRLVEGLSAENVCSAMDVDTGLTALKSQVFDAVLLDYELGGRDGIEILTAIRNNRVHPNHKTPVVLLTGHAESHVVKEAVMAGANGYLVKPVMPEVLGQRLRKVIAAHEETLGGNPATEVVWRRTI